MFTPLMDLKGKDQGAPTSVVAPPSIPTKLPLSAGFVAPQLATAMGPKPSLLFQQQQPQQPQFFPMMSGGTAMGALPPSLLPPPSSTPAGSMGFPLLQQQQQQQRFFQQHFLRPQGVVPPMMMSTNMPPLSSMASSLAAPAEVIQSLSSMKNNNNDTSLGGGKDTTTTTTTTTKNNKKRALGKANGSNANTTNSKRQRDTPSPLKIESIHDDSREEERALRGEKRLVIKFEDYGDLRAENIQYCGKKMKIYIPDGIKGVHNSYGEPWRFEVHYKNKDGAVLIHWKITNLATNNVYDSVEDLTEAEYRKSKGRTISNRVFKEAMRHRSEELEVEASKETDPKKAELIMAKVKRLRPRKFTEGTLVFGLQHQFLQLAIRSLHQGKDVDLTQELPPLNSSPAANVLSSPVSASPSPSVDEGEDASSVASTTTRGEEEKVVELEDGAAAAAVQGEEAQQEKKSDE